MIRALVTSLLAALALHCGGADTDGCVVGGIGRACTEADVKRCSSWCGPQVPGPVLAVGCLEDASGGRCVQLCSPTDPALPVCPPGYICTSAGDALGIFHCGAGQ